jgi:serine/threonine protein kinase
MGTSPAQGKAFDLWQPGQLLADRYRVEKCLQRSGTCLLYYAHDVFRNAAVLVLRPSPGVMAMEGGRQWFEHYAEGLLYAPKHPSLLRCDRASQQGGIPVVIAEGLDGESWDSAIDQGRLVELGPMLDVAAQVAEGVACLHAHGLIHYNVKPANVLLTTSGEAKVWKHGEAEGRTRAYASPEQLAGDRALTPATDVWSWAVSVLHMFVGTVAWPSGDKAPGAFRRYMQHGPARPGIVMMPGSLAAVLAACFKADPDRRAVSMEEVAESLRATQTGNGADASAVTSDTETDSEFDEQPGEKAEEPPAAGQRRFPGPPQGRRT